MCLVGLIKASKTNLTTLELMSSKPGLLFGLSDANAFLSSSSVSGDSFKIGYCPDRKLSIFLFDFGINSARFGPTLTKYLLNCSAIVFYRKSQRC